jgi:signal transduction histidine kinase
MRNIAENRVLMLMDLGLAIVKRVVDRHGGQIYASRNEHGGLTFHFTLSAGKEYEPERSRRNTTNHGA